MTENDLIDEAAKNGEYDITPAARAAVEALLEQPVAKSAPREFSRHEVMALSDYVAVNGCEQVNVIRLADGHLYIDEPNGNAYRLSPLETAARS